MPPPTIAASPTAGHTGPALQSFYQLRTPCPAPVGRGALIPPPSMHHTIKPCHCEERSDVAIRTPFAPHLQPCPCRAAPMCAAADNRRIPNSGAHWPRPTVVLPTPHPVSRTRRAGCPHPAAVHAPHHQTLSLRGAKRRGNPSPFFHPSFSPFRPKIKTKIRQNGETQKPLAKKGTQC